jgi:hypothetical protein
MHSTIRNMALPFFSALACGAAPVSVSAAPILGSTLASYAVLGASDVTCVTGPPCTIGGNLGSHPTAPTSPAENFVFSFGSYQPGSEGTAQTELDAAILAVNAGVGTLITGGDLDAWQADNGGFIAPGIYDVPAATTNLTGDLFLDGGGSNTAVWQFRFSSTLITSTTSNVSVINVGDGSGVGLYWTVGSAATINGPTFAGNVLANDLISSDGFLTLSCGRLLSANGAVTLIHDTISTGCGAPGATGFGSNGYDQAGATDTNVSVPEPATFAIFGLGLAAGLSFMRRRRET